MLVNKKRAREIARRLTPFKIQWMAQCDISVGEDEALLKLLQESGCKILFVGLESVNQSSIKELGSPSRGDI